MSTSPKAVGSTNIGEKREIATSEILESEEPAGKILRKSNSPTSSDTKNEDSWEKIISDLQAYLNHLQNTNQNIGQELNENFYQEVTATCLKIIQKDKTFDLEAETVMSFIETRNIRLLLHNLIILIKKVSEKHGSKVAGQVTTAEDVKKHVDDFRSGFKNEPMLDCLIDTLGFNSSQWVVAEGTHKKYYSSYVAIVNSSGFGKTRLCCELLKKYYGIYICLRKDQKGVPIRSFDKPNYFQDEKSILAFLLSCMKVIWGLREKNPENASPEKVFASYFDYQHRSEFCTFWNNVDTIFKSLEKTDKDEITIQLTFLNDQFVEIQSEQNRTDLGFIFVFDEIGSLLKENEDGFHLLRRALSNFRSSSPPPFGLFLDTSSKVTNFVPGKDKEKIVSHRLTEEGHQLYDPWYFLITADMYKSDLVTNEDELCLFERLIKYGRPMWHCEYEKRSSSFPQNREEARANARKSAMCSIITLAKEKLLGIVGKGDLNERQMLAAVAVRIGLFNITNSDLVEDLVASHAMVLGAVSDDRRYLHANYIHEPILALGSKEVTKNLKYGIMNDDLVMNIVDFMNKGMIGLGEAGEIAIRLILTAAFDAATNNELKAAKVHEFLKSLFSSACFENIQTKINDSVEKDDKFLSGLVFFQQFLYVDYTPRKKELFEALIGGYCFICKRNQKGMDLIIPVLQTGEFSLDNITAIIIQIKNRDSGASADPTTLSASYSGMKLDNDYFAMWFDIGNFKESIGRMETYMEFRKSPRSKDPSTIPNPLRYFLGADLGCFNSSLCDIELFKQIFNLRHDYTDYLCSKPDAFIQVAMLNRVRYLPEKSMEAIKELKKTGDPAKVKDLISNSSRFWKTETELNSDQQQKKLVHKQMKTLANHLERLHKEVYQSNVAPPKATKESEKQPKKMKK